MPKDLYTSTGGPTYGDKVKLEGVKQAGGTFGPMVQKSPVGRPAAEKLVPITPLVTPEPQQQVTPTEIPPEHRQLMAEYANAIRVARFWQERANIPPKSSFAEMYARIATQRALDAARALKEGTPDF